MPDCLTATRSYWFHGMNLVISGPPSILTALHSRLGRFPAGALTGKAHLRFDYQVVSDVSRYGIHRPNGSARPVLELPRGEVLYFEDRQLLYLDFPGHARALCDAKTGQVYVQSPNVDANPNWVLSHPLFTIPLADLSKRQGLYLVHAAVLALDNKAILFAGPSGSGKTTLAIALLRAGFGFLGDDLVFLSTRSSCLSVLAFPDEIDITEATAQFFPELHDLTLTSAMNGRAKTSFCATTQYGVDPTWHCTPALLVFPHPASSRQSKLVPLPKAEALLLLMENVLRTEIISSQAHLDALAMLVRLCPCYQLHTGRDFDALPGLIRSALE